METISKEELKSLARKLLFDMNDREYATLETEFSTILKQMELINKIEGISSVEPLVFPFPVEATFRKDELLEVLPIEDVIANAKEVIDREIKVPKVVE